GRVACQKSKEQGRKEKQSERLKQRMKPTSRSTLASLALAFLLAQCCNAFNPGHALTSQSRARHLAAPCRSTPTATLELQKGYDLFTTLPPKDAQKHVAEESTTPILDANAPPPFPGVDGFEVVKGELKPFTDSIRELVDTDHPVLSMAAKHFFEKRHGKRFRPTLVSLMAQVKKEEKRPSTWSHPCPYLDPPYHATASVPLETHKKSPTYVRQAQLGTITEMIHVASLIHDDVLDEAETRRGGMAVHKLYSNKVAVLAGDYLLARASVLLARLNNVEVVEIMATALDSLVQGEIMQLKSEPNDLLDMKHYLKKSYYKTASLICNASKSTAMLAGHSFDSDVARAAEEYGYHMGLAFQIVDDILDVTGAAEVLGKPAMADMSLGLATAPLLYAAEQKRELRPLIKRKFKNDGDVEQAFQYVMETDAVERSRELARFHAQSAVDAICRLPQSVGRDALVS
ncbi:unnamed protein product, partial [Chrysoparadoxa australica]